MICSLYDLPVDLGFSTLISKEPFLFWYNLLIKSTFHSTWWFLDWVFLSPRIQEYTEEWYKKDLHDPDNHDGMITHLEPDILECEVKWALGSITMNKAGGGDGIPVELFQILKDDAVKMLHSICQHIWKTQQVHRTRKSQFSFQSQRKAMLKNVQTTTPLRSSHMLAK